MSREGKIGVADALVLGGIAALPWFWGGTDVGSARFVAALLVAAGASLAVFESARSVFPRSSRSLWIPAVALAGFGALQAIPLPETVVALVSPQAHRHARASFPQRASKKALR